MGTSDQSELTWRERHAGLLRENKIMAAGADLHNQAYEKLQKDAKTLQAQVTRLTADLAAAASTISRLGAEINEAGKKANEEVIRLRDLCKENGINPNA